MATDDRPVPVETMDLVGGDVALDLVNTLTGRGTSMPQDKLGTYGDLVTWAERVHVAGAARGRRLRRAADEDPAAAARVLDDAKALRELVYRVFSVERPGDSEVAALGERAGAAAARRRIERDGETWTFGWPDSDALDQLLWPVALSAAELLVSEDRERVKQCAGDVCDWLFLDRSRNRSRRWCDMKDCGNRAKARRFQARQKRR